VSSGLSHTELEARLAELRRAEQILQAAEQRFTRFTRFTEHLPGLAWIKDHEGRYVFVNDAAERAFAVMARTRTSAAPARQASTVI
jgi:PAS domain-containing protein